MNRYCVTIGRCGSWYGRVGCIRIYHWGVKVYKLVKRRRDGAYTWRLLHWDMVRTGPHPSSRLEKDAVRYAQQHDVPYSRCVTHGLKANLGPLETIALDSTEDLGWPTRSEG